MQKTDIRNPDYFHKVVDCQWACPTHTPVPEYIRLIAAGRYSDAYMVNWESNVFPGILGRTCDRPCEPACRRGRVEEENQARPEPVAICRLKRVAADYKDDDVRARRPRPGPCRGASSSGLTAGSCHRNGYRAAACPPASSIRVSATAGGACCAPRTVACSSSVRAPGSTSPTTRTTSTISS